MKFTQTLKDLGVLYYLAKRYANINGCTAPYIFSELFKKNRRLMGTLIFRELSENIKRHSAPLIKLESLYKQ